MPPDILGPRPKLSVLASLWVKTLDQWSCHSSIYKRRLVKHEPPSSANGWMHLWSRPLWKGACKASREEWEMEVLMETITEKGIHLICLAAPLEADLKCLNQGSLRAHVSCVWSCVPSWTLAQLMDRQTIWQEVTSWLAARSSLL